MNVESDVRTGIHCVFLMHVHLVFVTKYRHAVFAGEYLGRLEKILGQVCADFGAELAEFKGGESEHVHVLVEYPPKVAVSRLVNSLKGVSSRRMRREFPELERHYWKARRLWAGSYFAGSVGGAPLWVVRRYIESEATPEGGCHPDTDTDYGDSPPA